MFIVIIAFLMLSASTSLSSETPRIEWQKTYGGSGRDEAEDLLITQSGDYIVLGRSTSSDGDITQNKGNVDVCLMKITANGQLLWQKTYGGSGSESANSLCTTKDGGYIFAGWTDSNDGDVSGLKGQVNYWVVKINSIGTIEWQKTYGGNIRDEASSIQQVSDGYIIAGRSSSKMGDITENKGSLDYWIVKIDNLGTIKWEKNYGGYDGDYPFTINQTHDGGYIIGETTWSSDGDVSDNKGMRDFWVVKIDKYGTILWEKVYGGSSTDYLQHVEITKDKGYIITGWTDSEDEDVRGNKGNFDIWVLKIDSVGTIEWQKTFGGNSIDQAYCIRQTSDNGYIIAAWTLSDNGDITQNKGAEEFWLIKLQPPSVSISESEEPGLLHHIHLFYNYNEEAVLINYNARVRGDYSFTLYSHEGIAVHNELYRDILQSQNYSVSFSTNNLPIGVYYVVIHNNLLSETEKCIIVR